MNFLTRRKPFVLAVLLAAASLSSWSGEGHDHGEAPAAVGGPAKPRFTATSEAFELVGVVDGKHIVLYLDHAADNSPVKGATLELELGGTKVAVQPHGEGEFEATLAAELQPGEISVSATVVAGAVTDLLAGDLDIHADTHADGAHGTTWKTYSAWAIGGLLVLALLAFAVRRLGAERNNRVGGAA
ncbi:hypothetical protein HZ993_06150 [Rhodoferax sp. AJA081-3]|nr:hypothetical protein HZ993_06150 [Rhodoferax sp. AJA081-3]